MQSSTEKVFILVLCLGLAFLLGCVLIASVGVATEGHGYECYLVWVGDSPDRIIVPEKIELEEKAIDLALDDHRVKELIRGNPYQVTSILGSTFRIVETRDNLLLVEWDGKIRALVTMIFADGSGYYVEVDLTDEIIEEIRFTQKVFPN